jgi:hypothetical protein
MKVFILLGFVSFYFTTIKKSIKNVWKIEKVDYL